MNNKDKDIVILSRNHLWLEYENLNQANIKINYFHGKSNVEIQYKKKQFKIVRWEIMRLVRMNYFHFSKCVY